jgi:hypothetical protein
MGFEAWVCRVVGKSGSQVTDVFILFLFPLPPGGPGKGPDCHFPLEIGGFGRIPDRIRGVLYFEL